MENYYSADNSTRYGTVGGTLLTILININIHEVFKTGVLAAIGAVVSFFVSLGLRQLVKFLKNRQLQKW
jgi:hypothetical protein